MNTKPTEATPSVVASLQTPAKDFNFQNILKSVKASKQPITKPILDVVVCGWPEQFISLAHCAPLSS